MPNSRGFQANFNYYCKRFSTHSQEENWHFKNYVENGSSVQVLPFVFNTFI